MATNNLHLSGGVGRKIFAAFFAVSFFSLASALVGWVGLGYVREAQDEVLSKVYPSARNAQIIARESTALVLQLTALFDAQSISQLDSITSGITLREKRISDLLSEIDGSLLFGESRVQIETIIADLLSDVETLSKLSKTTIESSDRFKNNLKRLIGLCTEIIEDSKNLAPIIAENTMVHSDRIYQLLLANQPEKQPTHANEFEGFVLQNFGNLQKVTDLEFRNESIRNQLVLLGEVNSVDQVRLLRDDVIINLRAVTNDITRLGIPGAQETFVEPLSQLSSALLETQSIFFLREKIITSRAAMVDVRALADASGEVIGEYVETINAKMEAVMNRQSTTAQAAASRTQLILIALAALAFAASAFIYLTYINNNIIFRLGRLSGSVSRLVGGDFSLAVPAAGNDEITRLEEAVEAFRGNSILLQESETMIRTRSAELERSNQDLQQFAYVTSHDLRAPLRAIGSLSEWVEEDLEEGNIDDVKSNLARLRNRVHRMDALLNGILLYARAGALESDNEHISFAETTQQIFDDLNPDAQKLETDNSKSSYSVKIESNVETLFTGSSFLQQILGNLISNAFKHHDKPKGVIEVKLVSDSLSNTLTVSDDGPGIPEKQREKIFKMFQTLKPRDEFEASGIGLALVKRLVENRKGNLSVDESSAGGACFKINWPNEGE